MVKCPCENCDRRTEICHDSCPEYLGWREKKRAANEDLRQKRLADSAGFEIAQAAVKKARKGR